ncbi:MAG: hypothetical protein J5594_02645 [Elusimicrobiaceae bacterium]|nr:hypothetical protein [Elusimicrobiaceae bacterium]
MKDFIYFVILLLIAAAIGYGFDALFSSVLSGKAANFFIDPFSIGIRPLGIHASICGIIGLVVSFVIIKPFLNK